MKTALTRLLILTTSFILFVSCQSNINKTVSIDAPQFYDQGFAEAKHFKVESEQDIFYLDDEAKMFVHNLLEPIEEPTEQMATLVHAIFDRSEMNLLYRGDANTLASETFHNRAANCLSMSIMMYSLAKEAGFHVDFQEVMVPESWSRRNGYSLVNGHINLRLSTSAPKKVLALYNPSYQVDFDPQVSRVSLPKKIVNKDSVIAMFYNNKGADALINNHFHKAYNYFREALTLNPEFQPAWINMAILYRHMEYFEQAESAYEYALNIDPNNLTVLENLAYLYSVTDRKEQANDILLRVEQKRKRNPDYHLNLGEEQIERKNWNEALAHFRKALTLDRSRHEIYYGLAKVYLQIGEVQQVERYLKLARNNASTMQEKDVYQAKLVQLSSL
ncbi:tetratricopeptide repeat protein [Paraglaciecola sp. L3A3]|uniref:tetratricopeptide repeat protein n=1 Tax=Paraglaciecola sp. L3A3 TaxID=2686358 RepID=UPI00131E400D|nr:tetratricopeptide repeat protein [Paraglaciecola sp. L3A3]